LRIQQLNERLTTAVGQVVWSGVVGPRGDSVIALELGEKLRRAVRLSNPELSFVHRTFEGSHRFVIECPWRLDGPEGIVATSSALLSRDAPPSLDLVELANRAVEHATGGALGLDLELVFSGGYRLHCLSTEIGKAAAARKRGNWSYWCPEGSVAVGPGGQIQIETRAQAEAGFRRLKKQIQDEPELPVRTRPSKKSKRDK
jgi:hypothetical protein